MPKEVDAASLTGCEAERQRLFASACEVGTEAGGHLHDGSDHSALEAMRAAKELAEATSRAKSNLLAVASHDLRQPVHALGLYMAALRAAERGPAHAEIVDHMSRSIASLQLMLNQLLDLSRIDAGAIAADVRPFALEPMLHRVANEFSAETAARGLRLSVRASRGAKHLNALSDPLLVERIVRNLVDNAVKYTRSGGILIACRLSGGSTGSWKVQVWDTGPGIHVGDRERIFNAFIRIGGAERARSDGMGLGLSIVRMLARLLGHRIQVDSIEGHGSRFALELPATEQVPSSQTPVMRLGSLEALAVGVIEHDQEVRLATRLLLESWGCFVTTGANADELLAKLGERATELAALIVDDNTAQDCSAMDAIGLVRGARGISFPALILTGASALDRIRELDATGFQWSVKPALPERLHRFLLDSARFRYHCLFDDFMTRREALAASGAQDAPVRT